MSIFTTPIIELKTQIGLQKGTMVWSCFTDPQILHSKWCFKASCEGV